MSAPDRDPWRWVALLLTACATIYLLGRIVPALIGGL